ncbi:uncharacterized protein RHOBADRAFT_51336 [Rhodotorula graminis WP1]|uniref:Uncharacterized protein n=1 Tax=Rhodotorula graminis (strain WP1) TaxID=578459 RepID=A0A194SAK5_RHOGW|nr:uncharacterized protein RHOBADRAFT_51336 [Rhodotorula graminis WP1]KPV77490.1 hypothetical protein RHOBADRAFT_51336 [Rhodotorula graminis WP1]
MAPPKQPPHQPAPERLEVPTLPPPSSRFVLPPPPSALLDRLQAFLPQIRDANAHLDPPQPGTASPDEAVVVEEITDSSDDDSSTDDDDSTTSDDDSDEGDSDDGETAERQQQGVATEQVAPPAGAADDGAGSLARLLDISARPTVVRSKLLVQEEPVAGAHAGRDDMQAD